MNVKQLIEELQKCEPTDEVVLVTFTKGGKCEDDLFNVVHIGQKVELKAG